MQQESIPPSFETNLRDQLIAAHDVAQAQAQAHEPASAYNLSTEGYAVPDQTDAQDVPIDPEMESQSQSDLHHITRPLLEGLQEAAQDQEATETPRRSRTSRQKELRGTKRAAQNRQAQRAFRERNKNLIDTLEARLKRFKNMEEGYRYLERQNYAMQTYIGILTERLSQYTQDIPSLPPLPEDPGPDPQYADQPHEIAADEAHAQAQAQAQAQTQPLEDYHSPSYHGQDPQPTYDEQPHQQPHSESQQHQTQLVHPQMQHAPHEEQLPHDDRAEHIPQPHMAHGQQSPQQDQQAGQPPDIEVIEEVDPVHQLRQQPPLQVEDTMS